MIHSIRAQRGRARSALFSRVGNNRGHNIPGELGIKWVFLLELPDRMGGRHGFVLPAREIIPVGHSVFHGVRRAALEVRRTFV